MDKQHLIEFFPKLRMYPDLLEELSTSATLKDFEVGDVLLNEGTYVQVIPLLVDGLIKVYKEEEGIEILLYYIKPGESCIMSVSTCIRKEKSKVKAVVEENSQIILIPAESNLSLTAKYPFWSDFFFELFNVKYEELLKFISIMTFSNKDARLMEYLRREVELKKSSILKITHKKIANDLGSPREVISRLLKKLEKEGLIHLSHGTIKVF